MGLRRACNDQRCVDVLLFLWFPAAVLKRLLLPRPCSNTCLCGQRLYIVRAVCCINAVMAGSRLESLCASCNTVLLHVKA